VELTIDLGEELFFDRILIQEPIEFGQRISKFQVLIRNINSDWELVAEETTIGFKRLLRINPTSASRIKLKITESKNAPAISNFGLFLSSEME